MRSIDVNIGDVFPVPVRICETGKVKIVGDHHGKEQNVLQPGVVDWDFIAMEYREDIPDAYSPNSFRIKLEELLNWQEELKG